MSKSEEIFVESDQSTYDDEASPSEFCVSELTWNADNPRSSKMISPVEQHRRGCVQAWRTMLRYIYNQIRRLLNMRHSLYRDINQTNFHMTEQLHRVGLNFSRCTLTFSNEHAQASFNRHYVSHFCYKHQIICIICPTIVSAAMQLWEIAESSSLQSHHIGYSILFAIYVIVCMAYIFVLHQVSTKIATIAVINVQEFREGQMNSNSSESSPYNDDGRDVLNLMGSHSYSSRGATVPPEEKQELDVLITWSLRLGCLVYFVAVVWVNAISFSGTVA